MARTSPEYVLSLESPTTEFLCPLSANVYGLEFLNFIIADYETKDIIFRVGKDSPPTEDISFDTSAGSTEDMMRTIRYTFSEDVLRLPYIQTTLNFHVGDMEVEDFRMIERHYFKGKLIKSFDFPFGFCIPGSTNNWDSVYAVPPLSDEQIQDMIDSPYETVSDSFYFVKGELVMHNKASFRYAPEPTHQPHPSSEPRDEDGDDAKPMKSYKSKYGSLAPKDMSYKRYMYAKGEDKGSKGSGHEEEEEVLFHDSRPSPAEGKVSSDFDTPEKKAKGGSSKERGSSGKKVASKKASKYSKAMYDDDDAFWSKESDYH